VPFWIDIVSALQSGFRELHDLSQIVELSDFRAAPKGVIGYDSSQFSPDCILRQLRFKDFSVNVRTGPCGHKPILGFLELTVRIRQLAYEVRRITKIRPTPGDVCTN
jgi:hypothetical protein